MTYVLIKHLFSILANQLDSLKYSWYCFLFLPPPPLFNKFTVCMLMKIKEFFAFHIYHGYLVIWWYPSSETSKLFILIFSLFVEEKLEANFLLSFKIDWNCFRIACKALSFFNSVNLKGNLMIKYAFSS